MAQSVEVIVPLNRFFFKYSNRLNNVANVKVSRNFDAVIAYVQKSASKQA